MTRSWGQISWGLLSKATTSLTCKVTGAFVSSNRRHRRPLCSTCVAHGGGAVTSATDFLPPSVPKILPSPGLLVQPRQWASGNVSLELSSSHLAVPSPKVSVLPKGQTHGRAMSPL